MSNPIVVTFDKEKFAAAVLKFRGKRGLREVAASVNSSASTISRIERCEQCDIETYAALCAWMGVSLGTFIIHWKVSR